MVNKVLKISGIEAAYGRFPDVCRRFDRIRTDAAPSAPFAPGNSITFTRI
jgi:hypothetical protein